MVLTLPLSFPSESLRISRYTVCLSNSPDVLSQSACSISPAAQAKGAHPPSTIRVSRQLQHSDQSVSHYEIPPRYYHLPHPCSTLLSTSAIFHSLTLRAFPT